MSEQIEMTPGNGTATTASAPARNLRIAPVAIIIGGALYVAGSALPWISTTDPVAGTVTRSGLEGGAGIIAIVLGILMALTGVRHATGSKAAGSRTAIVLLSTVALGFAGLEVRSVSSQIFDFEVIVQGVASTGIGLWTMVVGALIALAGASRLSVVAASEGGEPKATWESEPPDWVAKSPNVNREAEEPPSRGKWLQAAFMMAAVWLGISLALGLIAINWIGLAFLFGGFPALWIAGRISGLRGRRAWILAGVLGFAITLVGGTLAGVFVAMAIYG